MQRETEREDANDPATHSLTSEENSTSIYGDVKEVQKTACLVLV